VKLLQAKIEKTLQDTGIVSNFLNRTPIVLKIATDKWDYIKLKGFCTAKEIITIVKENSLQNGRKPLLAIHLIGD
jgi:hypothetical protein